MYLPKGAVREPESTADCAAAPPLIAPPLIAHAEMVREVVWVAVCAARGTAAAL